ncbi:MAG: PIG-L deacetylase family protein [Terriglobales bacterium]
MARRILCVTAHPDDEAANFGGTVLRSAREGVESRLICLTSGEAARNRGGAKDSAELKTMRHSELAASCDLLGFASHEIWDLGDSHLPEAPFYYAVGRLVAEMRRFQPDLLLTMGPEGSITAHADHGMAGTLATTAFHWAARDRYFPEQGLAPHRTQRLYYATALGQPPGFATVWLPFPDVAVDIGEFLERKIAAFRLHQTQAPLFDRVEKILGSNPTELFHLAAGAPLPAAAHPGTDLWLGLK